MHEDFDDLMCAFLANELMTIWVMSVWIFEEGICEYLTNEIVNIEE